ncbi:hypothetical protein FKM82_027743 [Ascaphus truei]
MQRETVISIVGFQPPNFCNINAMSYFYCSEHRRDGSTTTLHRTRVYTTSSKMIMQLTICCSVMKNEKVILKLNWRGTGFSISS